jgi:hypothetical protein
MERVNITIGRVTFDHADYDADNDVLYLHVGPPQEADGEETPEGHVIRYAWHVADRGPDADGPSSDPGPSGASHRDCAGDGGDQR